MWEIASTSEVHCHTLCGCLHIQDIIRKTMGDELPDFYNIVLERPRDDPTGYDVIFIDAAAKVWRIPSCALLELCRMLLCSEGRCNIT